jgi:predicted permease
LAGLILLAACANLGSLFGARAADRGREVALRLALGASRGRILRQLLTEAVLIALIGGAVGLWASSGLLRALSVWRPLGRFPIHIPVQADANVYIVALLLALVSGLLFGIVPVRQVLKSDPYQVVKAGMSMAIGRRITMRDLLLVLQVAICAILVTASIVAVRGLERSVHANLGFDPRNVLLVDTDLAMAGYPSDRAHTTQRRMIDAMQSIPGVTDVALVSPPPLDQNWQVVSVYKDETTDLRPSNIAQRVMRYVISPEYFRTANTALLAGRSVTWHDDKDMPHVAVVNREFARRMFGSEANAIGAHYKVGSGVRIEVVGIVEDGKYISLTESSKPAMFLPLLQAPMSETSLVVRSTRDTARLSEDIRGAIRELDPAMPAMLQTWDRDLDGAMFVSRVATVALGVMGMIGAILAVTGVFGTAAYSVSKRLRELGIRMALGAGRKAVLGAGLGRAFKLLVVGSAAGLILGTLSTQVLASIVYQASPRDPEVLIGAVVAMSALGLLATWIPAQRALSLEPVRLLREE